jgi:prolyl oligopeptidase
MAGDKLIKGWKAAQTVIAPRDGTAVIDIHGRSIPDPFRPLENKNTSAAWVRVEEENFQESVSAEGQAAFVQAAAGFRDEVQKGVPVKAGDNYLFYYRGKGEAQARVMVSDTPDGEGRTLIDPLAIDPSGKTGVEAYPSPDGKYVACRIRRADIWESEVRVVEVETGKTLDEKFKDAGTIVWDKDSRGFAYNYRPEPGKSGRVTYGHHVLGQDCAADKPYYDATTREGPTAQPGYGFHYNHMAYDGPQEWVYWGMAVGTRDLKPGISMKSPGDDYFRVLVEPGTADVSPVGDNGSGKIIAWTTEGAEKGRVVLIDPANPAPGNWQTLIPAQDDALQHAFVHGGRIYGVYMHDSADRLSVFSKQGEHITDVDTGHARLIFGHAQNAGLALGGNLPAQGGELLFRAETYTGTPRVMAYNPDANAVRPLDPGMAGLQLDGCIVETIHATSPDGTKVPITVIRREGVQLDGSAALKITGYGGTGCSQGPGSDPEVIDFVKSGGIYAVAHIRGGSELGKAWHDGGRGENKENCIEDFNACVRHLVDQRYTSPQRLVAQGFSHGGFVVLGAMEREPALYGAVIAGCPLTDQLLRDRTVSSDEFADPYASPRNLDIALKTSPLHNITPGAKYPPVLVHTAENDFLYAHSLKFVAALRALCPDVKALLHVEKGYGHSMDRPPEIEADEGAKRRAFVEQAIGPIGQDAWQATQKPATAGKVTAKAKPSPAR